MSAFPGLNFGTLQDGIITVSPVCGFLPSRAARSVTSNDPNPANKTLSPLTRFSLITSNTSSTISPIFFCVISECLFATSLITSFLFIYFQLTSFHFQL